MMHDYYNRLNKTGSIEEVITSFNPLYVHILLFITWLIFPVLSIFPICFLLYYARLTRGELLFYFLLLALVPGLINYTKTPATDLAIYVAEYRQIYKLDLATIRTVFPTDSFFYGTSWIVGQLSGGNTQVFPLFWTTFTYFVFFNAIYEFNKIFQDGKKRRMVGAIFFALFIGLDFSLSAHLMRQYPGAALLSYGLARFVRGKKDSALFFVLAFLTHFSTIVFVVFLLLASTPRKVLRILLPVLFLAVLIAGRQNILSPEALASLGDLPLMSSVVPDNIVEKASIYVEKDDGSLNMRLYAELAFYVLIVVYMLVWGGKNYSPEAYSSIRRFGMVFLLFLSFLLLVRSNNLLLLRYFFYLHFLSVFVLLLLFRINNYVSYTLFVLYVVSAPLRFMKASGVNPYSYIDNSYDIVFYNVINFLSYKVI